MRAALSSRDEIWLWEMTFGTVPLSIPSTPTGTPGTTPTDSSSTTQTRTSSESPGFGLLAAVLGIAGGLGAYLRSRSTD